MRSAGLQSGASVRRVWALSAAGLLASIAAPAWSVTPPPPVTVIPLAVGAAQHAAVLSKIVNSVPEGSQIGMISTGPFLCIPRTPAISKVKAGDVKVDPAIQALFNSVLASAGFKTVGAPSRLFQSEADTGSADLEVGAEVTGFHEDICYPFVDPGSNILNNYGASKGSMQVDVHWQVFSTLEQKVVADIYTTGGATLSKTVPDAEGSLATESYTRNIQALVNSSKFRDAVTAPVIPAGQRLQSGSQPVLSLTASNGTATIADSVGSVVSVFAGNGFGSGFVVGDGYLITNRHVVGDVSTVKIKWPDGLEFSGEVLRSDARRDVALIKTDTRGRPALMVRAEPLQPGDTVFAIGTPLDPSLQNTVTRGVVSAIRTIDGLAFIQSDVTVNHGNSGGPLLDDKAKVVGLTVSRYEPDGASVGINLFIPIRDAIDFLALSIHARG